MHGYAYKPHPLTVACGQGRLALLAWTWAGGGRLAAPLACQMEFNNESMLEQAVDVAVRPDPGV